MAKVEENDKRMSEVMRKLNEETNNRAKAEAEVIRAHKMIDYLQELLEDKRAVGNMNGERAMPRCFDQDRVGGCQYRNLCLGLFMIKAKRRSRLIAGGLLQIRR